MWEPCLSGDCVHIKPRSRVETPLERCWKVPISYLMKLATWQPHTVSVQVWRRYGQLADCIQSAKTWKKRGSGSIHISSPLCEWYQYISQEHNMFEFPKRLCNLSFFLQSFGKKKRHLAGRFGWSFPFVLHQNCSRKLRTKSSKTTMVKAWRKIS